MIAIAAVNDKNELYNMVYDVNRSEVAKEDYLADDVYFVKGQLLYSALRKNPITVPAYALAEDIYE